MRSLIVGGAGFIGSHLAPVLDAKVYDRQHGYDVHDFHSLLEAMRGMDLVVHLASNADIAKAATDPTLDFREGTQLTQNVAEAARLAGVNHIWYASGSGVYGDHGGALMDEDTPCRPISTYGASKLAGEAILAAYHHLFGINIRIFRFANVVGPGQTHGVGYDFMRALKADPTVLNIKGDGTQSKHYLHVNDAIAAMRHVAGGDGYEVYNVATPDRMPVMEIAGSAVEVLGCHYVVVNPDPQPEGWAGDVPNVALDTAKIRATGWKPVMNSREAMLDALKAMA